MSVHRPTLAAKLGVSETMVKRRVRAAKDAGLLDTVTHGHNGMTAVYQRSFLTRGTVR